MCCASERTTSVLPGTVLTTRTSAMPRLSAESPDIDVDTSPPEVCVATFFSVCASRQAANNAVAVKRPPINLEIRMSGLLVENRRNLSRGSPDGTPRRLIAPPQQCVDPCFDALAVPAPIALEHANELLA